MVSVASEEALLRIITDEGIVDLESMGTGDYKTLNDLFNELSAGLYTNMLSTFLKISPNKYIKYLHVFVVSKIERLKFNNQTGYMGLEKDSRGLVLIQEAIFVRIYWKENVLVETHEKMSDGRVRSRNYLPHVLKHPGDR